MLKHLLEQKNAIVATLAMIMNSVTVLSSNQWQIVEHATI
jgi:hypothetical protein